MAEKDKSKKPEPKLILEREYTVPLRREWLKVAKHKRANRAVKALKKFLARHMNVYDGNLNKIKIDIILNNEIRFRGMKKPPAKIRVLARKFDNGLIKAELVNIPEHIKFARLKEEKINQEIEKRVEEISESKKIEGKEEKQEVKEIYKEKEGKEIEAREKETASIEESLRIAKEQAREQKHVSKLKEAQAKQNIGGKRSQRGR